MGRHGASDSLALFKLDRYQMLTSENVAQRLIIRMASRFGLYASFPLRLLLSRLF